MAPKLERGKYCFMADELHKDENGYIPVVIVEGDPMLYPMSGNGAHALPWYFGKTLAEAQSVCDNRNRESLGLSNNDVVRIIASSISASNAVQSRTRSY